jgi:hypothetical protein
MAANSSSEIGRTGEPGAGKPAYAKIAAAVVLSFSETRSRHFVVAWESFRSPAPTPLRRSPRTEPGKGKIAWRADPLVWDRLSRAGVPVELHIYPRTYHGFYRQRMPA